MKAIRPISEPSLLSRLELKGGLSLVLTAPGTGLHAYPTDSLQKGWLLACGGRVMAGEGTGFALPLARYGYRMVFPASAQIIRLSSDGCAVSVRYVLALAERLSPGGNKDTINSEAFYRAREYLCAVHRNVPLPEKGHGRMIRKDFAPETARRAVEMAKNAGLRTGAFFILCYPGDTADSVLETIRFSTPLPLDYLSFTVPYPIPV